MCIRDSLRTQECGQPAGFLQHLFLGASHLLPAGIGQADPHHPAVLFVRPADKIARLLQGVDMLGDRGGGGAENGAQLRDGQPLPGNPGLVFLLGQLGQHQHFPRPDAVRGLGGQLVVAQPEKRPQQFSRPGLRFPHNNLLRFYLSILNF